MPKANGKLLKLRQLMNVPIVQVGQLAKFVQSRDGAKLVRKAYYSWKIGDLEAILVDL